MAKKLNSNAQEKGNKISVPTQNNLSKIINAQIEDYDKIIKQLIKTASAYDNYKTVLESIENYRIIVNQIFSNNGIIMSMIRVMESIDAEKSNKNIAGIKQFVGSLEGLINFISNKVAGISVSASTLDLTILEKTYTKVVTAIEQTMQILGSIKINWFLPIKLFFIRLQFWFVRDFIDGIGNDALTIGAGLANVIKAFAKFKLLEVVTNSLEQVFDNILNMKIRLFKLWWKSWKIKRALKILLKIIKTVANFDTQPAMIIRAAISILTLNIIFRSLRSVIENIRNTKIGLKFHWKLWRFKRVFIKLTRLINVFKRIDSKAITPARLKAFLSLFVIVATMSYMLRIIRRAKVGLWTLFKLSMFRLAIKKIARLMQVFNSIRIRPTMMQKLNKIKKFIKRLTKLFNTIALSTPAILISILAIPVLVGAMLLLKLGLKIIYKIVNSAARGAKKAIRKLSIIMTFITMMSIMMVILAVVSAIVVSAAVPILLFFGIFVVVLIGIIAIGYLALAVSAVLTPAIAGIGIITLAITMLVILALMLKALESIKLDKELITNNVDTILDCAFAIISAIFNRDDDTKSKQSDKTWLESVIGFFGSSLGSIIQAIMSVAFLAIVIAAVFLITLIALQLRLIQCLDLDPEKIKSNVRVVIDSSLLIIDTIFNRPDTDSTKSDKSWLGSLLEYIDGPLTVIKAIMAVAFLAVVIAAISLIVLISLQLRLLQCLDLDAEKIKSNVKIVIDTAQMVIDVLFNHPDSESQKSDKDWLGSFLEYIGGPFKIIKAIMAVAYLATVILVIGLMQLIARQLYDISKIDLPSDITAKVNQILICADQVVDALINREDTLKGQEDGKKKGFLSTIFSGIGDALSFMSSIAWVASALCAVGMVSQIAKYLEDIKNFEKADNIMTNTTLICNTADNVIKQIDRLGSSVDIDDFEDRLEMLEDVYDVMEDLGDLSKSEVENIEKATKSYINLIESVNTMDVARVNATTGMFKQMANFSETINGNFEKLAEALSEKLMPVLEDLKEIVSGVPNKIDVGFQNTSASIAAANSATSKENVEAQIKRENPNMSKEDLDKAVQNRLNEKAKADAHGVEAKLDDLISLLKGFNGQVKVKTI